jgi:hypothetical protein
MVAPLLTIYETPTFVAEAGRDMDDRSLREIRKEIEDEDT